MKLISSEEVIESTVEIILNKAISHDILKSTEPNSSLTINRMMKEAKGSDDNGLPVDYSNVQIKKSETINGTSSPIKKIIEAAKSSLSFDVTVKKVTIPPQWEVLNKNSMEDKALLQNKEITNGITNDHSTSKTDINNLDERRKNAESSDSSIINIGKSNSDQNTASLPEVENHTPSLPEVENENCNLSDDKVTEDKHSEKADNLIIPSSGDSEDNGNRSDVVADMIISNECVKSKSFDTLILEAKEDVNSPLKEEFFLNTETNVSHKTKSSEKHSETTTSRNSSKRTEHSDTSEISEFANSGLAEDKSAEKKDEVDTIASHSSDESSKERNGESKMPFELAGKILIENEHSSNDKSSDDVLSEESDSLTNVDTEVSKCIKINDTSDYNMDEDDKSNKMSSDYEMDTDENELTTKDIYNNVQMEKVHSEDTEASVKELDENFNPEPDKKLIDLKNEGNQNICESSDIEMLDDEHQIINSRVLIKKSDVHDISSDIDVNPYEQSKPLSNLSENKNTSVQNNDTMQCSDISEHLSNMETSVSETELNDDLETKESSDEKKEETENITNTGVKTSNNSQSVPLTKEKSAKLEEEQSISCAIIKPSEDIPMVEESNEIKISNSSEDTLEIDEADRLVRKRHLNLDLETKEEAGKDNKRTKIESKTIENSENILECHEDVSNKEGNYDNTEKNKKETEKKDGDVDIEASENKRTCKNTISESVDSAKCSLSENKEEESECAKNITEIVNENCGSEHEKSKMSRSEIINENCVSEHDKQKMSEETITPSSTKSIQEQLGLIEVKKVRFTPEMEKQLKLAESKANSTNKSTNVEQSPSQNNLAQKSNLDLAIERVVAGITVVPDDPDDPDDLTEVEKIDEPQPEKPRKLCSMPFMRDIHQNLLKKLTRKELEEFVVQKLCEAVTDRSRLGETRQKCQSLEQMVDQWRKKAQQLQKQLKDMEMVMKRYISDARVRKERPIPVKITRSVGLQVHMGTIGQGLIRNRPLGESGIRSQGPMRKRMNRASSPSGTGTSQQSSPSQTQQPQQVQSGASSQPHQVQQPQPPSATTPSQQILNQQQQPRQSQPIVRTPATNSMNVQKIVTPGFTKLVSTPTTTQNIVSRSAVTTHVVTSSPSPLKVGTSSVKPPVGRPTPSVNSTMSASTTGSLTSTINTINSTIVNTSNNLRIASASQLNSRTQPKQVPSFPGNKSNPDMKIIDLTDEEDRAKAAAAAAANLRHISPTASTVTTNLVSTTNVTTGVPVSSAGIHAGSIRVVQPHQLTGSTTTTIIGPPATTPPNSRVAYFVPTTVQQRQVLIANSSPQVRPGVMTVSGRQNQLQTIFLKNGTVVPIQQASGTSPMNTAILRPGPPVQPGQIQQVLNPPRPGQPIRVPSGLMTTVGRMTAPSVASFMGNRHPAPLPAAPPYQPSNPNWKMAPPKPELKISKVANKHQQGIVLSWNMQLNSDFEEIASYQLYAYQESSTPPSTALWKKVGDVKALPLPMACTLTQFMEGHKYHFAVRAVDVHTRVGPFSISGSIVLTRK